MTIFLSKIKSFQKSKILLLAVFIIIIITNMFLYLNRDSEKISTKISHSRKDASGFTYDYAKNFIYFYYYTGNFPLATMNDSLVYSKQGAITEIEENGENLIMEFKHWSRLGENARIFMFLPYAVLKKSPEKPSIIFANTLLFILALMALFWGFWQIDKAYLGLLLIVLINTSSFYMYEVYGRENVFALMGIVFFIVLGLNLKLLTNHKKNIYVSLVLLIVSSFLIGLISEIRNETAIVLCSMILLIVLAKGLNIKMKGLYLIVVIAVFMLTKQSIQLYFEKNFESTAELVQKHGGHVYTGGRIKGHKLWHPIFCGLGDFDTKYGYKWNDKVAYQYAIPILKEQYKIDVNYSGKYYLDDYYDNDSLYYKKFDEVPEYELVMKEKVIGDIKNDFWWYAEIILKRISRTMTQTNPIQYIGWLLIPMTILLFYRKNYLFLYLLLISLPLSATSILIYSGDGSTNNSVFGFFIVIIFIDLLYELITKKLRNSDT